MDTLKKHGKHEAQEAGSAIDSVCVNIRTHTVCIWLRLCVYFCSVVPGSVSIQHLSF